MIPTPECNLPQEPSPVEVIPFQNNEWVVISQPDWAVLGGWIYAAREYIRAAGPCLRGGGSDVRVGNGVIGGHQ